MGRTGRFVRHACLYAGIILVNFEGGNVSLKGAKLIDFTGTVPGFESHAAFNDGITKALRAPAENKTVVVIDRGFGFSSPQAHLVRDHINFTGYVPLVGPNDSCGDRFPVVNDIYLTQLGGKALPQLRAGVAGGLKAGVVPTAEEEAELRRLGADFFCYNLVHTMIVAAHAGWKVVAIVLPENEKLDGQLITELQG